MSDPDDNGIDWSKTPEPVVRDILAQADTFLQAQFQSAVASDQRATTMAGLFVTLSTAVFAGVAALWTDIPDNEIFAGVATGIALLLAAASAAWAARPIDFWFPGSRPEQWYDGRLEDPRMMLGGAAELAQESIDENEAFMAGNQTALRISFVLAISSPLVGFLVWRIA